MLADAANAADTQMTTGTRAMMVHATFLRLLTLNETVDVLLRQARPFKGRHQDAYRALSDEMAWLMRDTKRHLDWLEKFLAKTPRVFERRWRYLVEKADLSRTQRETLMALTRAKGGFVGLVIDMATRWCDAIPRVTASVADPEQSPKLFIAPLNVASTHNDGMGAQALVLMLPFQILGCSELEEGRPVHMFSAVSGIYGTMELLADVAPTVLRDPS
jgi:hypothetical protein